MFSIAFGISVDDSLHFSSEIQARIEGKWLEHQVGSEEFHSRNRIEHVLYFCGSILWILRLHDLKFCRQPKLRSVDGHYRVFVAMLSNLLVLPSFLNVHGKMGYEERFKRKHSRYL